jgi:transcriptional regulator with XRE-family HTH domain
MISKENLEQILKQTKQCLQQSIKQQIKSESDLARLIGVSRQSINKWLNTEQVSYEKLFELMQTIKLEVDLVIKEKE